MNTEFEIVFTSVNHDDFREQIIQLGWLCVQEKTLMKRVVFENPRKPKTSYVRVRDEWDRITCTYKDVSENTSSIDAVKELDVVIDNYDAMVEIFTRLWLKKKAYQETYRETWTIDDEVEIMLDIWPGLNPFIEIESHSESIVKKYTELFWFDYDEWIFWSVDQVYLQETGILPDVINNLKEITFDNPPIK